MDIIAIFAGNLFDMVNKKNHIKKRKFSYTSPIMYDGEYYPTAESVIDDGQGNKYDGRIFADANGQYYTLDSAGDLRSVMPEYNLDEVVVNGGKRSEPGLDALVDQYLTMSNDNTQVGNRKYNSHLDARASRGERSYASWRKDHPNAAAWGDLATAVPFAVAAAPAVIGGGQAALGTELGQAAVGLGSRIMANPIVDMVNNVANLGFAGKAGYDISQGEFTPGT